MSAHEDPTQTMLERRKQEGPKFKKVRCLGQGGEGEAYLYVGATGQPFVLKVPHKESYNLMTNGTLIPYEADMLFSLLLGRSHYTIEPLWYHFTHATNPSVCAVSTKFYNGGDLNSLFKKITIGGLPVPEAFVWHVFLHLGAAVLYLHTGKKFHPDDGSISYEDVPNWVPIVHRDIKAENILLLHGSERKDKSVDGPELVLADFGLATATLLYESHFATRLPEQRVLYASLPEPILLQKAAGPKCGTRLFNPPELYGGKHDNPIKPADYIYPKPCAAHDIFQVGVVLYKLCLGKALPDNWKREELFLMDGYSPQLRDLITGLMGSKYRMVSPDPSRRLTDDQLLEQLVRARHFRAECMPARCRVPTKCSVEAITASSDPGPAAQREPRSVA